jgi:hypothetical protein
VSRNEQLQRLRRRWPAYRITWHQTWHAEQFDISTGVSARADSAEALDIAIAVVDMHFRWGRCYQVAYFFGEWTMQRTGRELVHQATRPELRQALSLDYLHCQCVELHRPRAMGSSAMGSSARTLEIEAGA